VDPVDPDPDPQHFPKYKWFSKYIDYSTYNTLILFRKVFKMTQLSFDPKWQKLLAGIWQTSG
jgi:hypothetical protein